MFFVMNMDEMFWRFRGPAAAEEGTIGIQHLWFAFNPFDGFSLDRSWFVEPCLGFASGVWPGRHLTLLPRGLGSIETRCLVPVEDNSIF